MFKTPIILFLLFLFSSGKPIPPFLSVAGQQLLQISTPHHHGPLSHSLGVSLHQQSLTQVSTSVLMAEKWLRTHVLAHYPSTNITSIVVSNGLLCHDDNNNFENEKEMSRLTLASMENVHHSLVRWGLEKKIKVSVLVGSKCLQKSYLRPVFELLEEINSTYTMNPPEFVDQTVGVMDSGVFGPYVSKQANPTSRKLAYVPETGYSVPSDAETTPLPPLIGVFPPEMQPPVTSPPPHYAHLPPCNPYHGGHGGAAPPPLVGAMAPFGHGGVWCVAKPSVPSEKLQEAMDYACGEGGADCDAISPSGKCYFPDSIVAHASYAFNSYWQKNKNSGGSCGFGGTAMLITSDPSFLGCDFALA